MHRRRKSRWNRLPPGPLGWPVVGHIFSLGNAPHKTITGLKQQYGPVIWLNLGSLDTMVISSAEVAANFFRNHDAMFANRKATEALRSCDFHKSAMVARPYDRYQRFVKRLCTTEMFSNKKLNEWAAVRQKCVNDLLVWVEKEEGLEVHMSDLAFMALYNMIGNLVLSRDLVNPQLKVGSEFFVAIMGMAESFGLPNISDVFPWLKGLDLQGIRKKTDREMGTVMEVVSGLVKQRIVQREKEKGRENRRQDFLDVLLSFEGSGKDEPAKLSEWEITIFIMEMFMGGTETSSSTIEWAMTEILRNPKIIIKIKAELNKIIGPNKKLEDNDIGNLHYLQAVIKETLRLHPPVPFVPRKAIEDTSFMGYHIPKNTQVFVNVWAIGRDPECWDDPLSFIPERFLDSKFDSKGENFAYIPFGAGRRMCPGISLSQRALPLVLGSLLHEFDWELGSQVSPEKVDMTEKLSMATRKLEPLKAIPKRSKV
ncbi:hypothetical protein LguiB_006211 [Lonicera macranthoides]